MITVNDVIEMWKQTGQIVRRIPMPEFKLPVQCDGCGYTHNEDRCPSCGRLVTGKEIYAHNKTF